MEALIQERREYELLIYDYLVSPIIPDEFWDPVMIGLDEQNKTKLKTVYEYNECIICCYNKHFYKEMPCCKNNICSGCVDTWFNKSVRCPFCKHDLRELT